VFQGEVTGCTPVYELMLNRFVFTFMGHHHPVQGSLSPESQVPGWEREWWACWEEFPPTSSFLWKDSPCSPGKSTTYRKLEAFYTIWMLGSLPSDLTPAPLCRQGSLKMRDSFCQVPGLPRGAWCIGCRLPPTALCLPTRHCFSSAVLPREPPRLGK